MENTVENENTEIELYNLGGSLVGREEYMAELHNDFESCTGEIMFDASNEELNEYIKTGTPEEQRYARQEICIRQNNKSHIPDIELETILCEMENTVTSINDKELDALITELENGWLADKNKFNENGWSKICDKLSEEAREGCGLSYEIFAQKVSAAIEFRISKLPECNYSRAIEIAKKYGYATPEEMEESQEFYDDMDCCSHGIDFGCCPAGCGS